MTTSTSDAKDLMNLAERMGIPVDEAVRQLAQLSADAEAPVAPPASTEEEVVSSVVA